MSGLNRASLLAVLLANASAPIAAIGRAIMPSHHATIDQNEDPHYRGGQGFTAAHVKRMAKKHRNQQRHKAACRRKVK